MAKGIVQQRDFIVDYLRRNQSASRLHIAREFDMHPSTVGNIVGGLLADGLVVETRESPPRAGAGRPPRLLRLNPEAGHFLGLDVYRRKITAVLTDFSGIPRREFAIALPADPEREAVLNSMIDTLRRVLDTAKDLSLGSLRGIGAGLPGLVDREAGRALSYRPIRNWHDVAVQEILEKTFEVPVAVEHNGNTMALGEACFGAAAGHDHVVAVLLRTGVSIGEARHREILRFSSAGSGELGHTIIDENGPRCWCGARGCLEAFASGWALRDYLWDYLRDHPAWPGRAAFSADDGFDPAALCRLAVAGDTKAEASLRDVFHYLGLGIQTVARLLAPAAVVISGPFHAAEALIREEVLRVLALPKAHPPRQPEIIVSREGDRMGAAGAALLAAARFCNPILRMPQ